MPSLKNASHAGQTASTHHHQRQDSVPPVTSPIEITPLSGPVFTPLPRTVIRAIASRPPLVLPALRMIHSWLASITPALRTISTAVPVVILRWQLALKAWRQILLILTMLRVGAAWIVLIRTTADAIAAAVRLIDPDTPRRIGLHRQRQAQAQQQ